MTKKLKVVDPINTLFILSLWKNKSTHVSGRVLRYLFSEKNVLIFLIYIFCYLNSMEFWVHLYWSMHFFIKIREQISLVIFFPFLNSPSGPRPPHWRGFEIILRHTTLGRTPLAESSARRREIYLPIHTTHKNRHPACLWGSNPQSQRTSDRSPTPYIRWQLESAFTYDRWKNSTQLSE